jgi:predicted amidohydrolase YtcJ
MVRKPFRPGQPEQAQTLEQTLASYTRDNAWVEFAEDRKGMRATIGDGQVTYEAG